MIRCAYCPLPPRGLLSSLVPGFCPDCWRELPEAWRARLTGMYGGPFLTYEPRGAKMMIPYRLTRGGTS